MARVVGGAGLRLQVGRIDDASRRLRGSIARSADKAAPRVNNKLQLPEAPQRPAKWSQGRAAPAGGAGPRPSRYIRGSRPRCATPRRPPTAPMLNH